ncbi:unnamed protein product [Phytophthora lilii]|uniref:Protein arginine methyltransferase NDUFAF7 n=1 Tax=Phytophthora lilii TaxID=2077276 RepID=A0A9W6U7F8_9STRA|nr:unnamed protein product [Phytophthora lilii]
MWSLSTRLAVTARGAASRRAAMVAAFSSAADAKGEKLAQQAKKWQQQKPEDKAKFLSVQVDRSALKQAGALPSNAPVELPQGKSAENSLVHVLRSMIEVKGPLTVAEFMTRALSHPDHGYYMKKDVFGSQGDFTTAPEISQMFGELIAVWCVATWQQMGMPAHIKIVEMGPGRGSLMSDFLRAAKSFPPFYNAIEIHMVDISPDIDFEDGGDHFRFVLSPGPTPATRVFIGREKLFDPSTALSHVAETHISGVEDLKKMQDSVVQRLDVADVAGTPVRTAQAQVGDKIEISPVSIALVQDMAKRISQSGGGALIVDYGYDHPSEISLRGIKNHKFVSVLREPGDVDLSIDVDFATLRRFATAEPKVKSSGPVGQGTFLKNMGIEHRLAMLLQNTESEKVQEDLFSSYERLVEPEQMGTIFKAMALTHEDIGQPVGFEEIPTENKESN